VRRRAFGYSRLEAAEPQAGARELEIPFE